MSAAGARNCPPVSTRFRKGQSGNPRGRPIKQPVGQRSAFNVVIDRTLTIVQNGKRREVTVDEALQHKTYQDAIAGNRASRREVLKMIAKREKALAAKVPAAKTVIVRNEGPDARNADEAMLILGICRADPCPSGGNDDQKHLLLEPWAVKAALARRPARKLNKPDTDEAKHCTYAAETVRWPEVIDP